MNIIDNKKIENINCSIVTVKEAIEIYGGYDEKNNFLKSANGVGLAAPQFGDFRKYFLAFGMIIFNPSYKARKKGINKSTEGCLSYPNLTKTIKRHKFIIANYQILLNDELVDVEKNLKGLSANIFQHETDHVGNGVFSKSKTINM